MSILNLGDSLIMNSDIVANTEIKTGATYGGKPVYMKCITGTTNSTTSETKQIATGITNADTCLFYTSNIRYSTSSDINGNFYVSSTNGSIIYFAQYLTNLYINAYVSWMLGVPFVVFVWYTKTTD